MDSTTIAQTLAARARPASPDARPASPDLPTPMASTDLANALYGNPSPLPSWLPQNVQSYIRSRPSYGEGDVQAPSQWYGADQRMTQDTPPAPYRPTLPPGDVKRMPMSQPYVNPQPGDVQRLFGSRIMGNAPIYAQDDPAAASQREMLKKLMQLPNFGGFTGGEDI